MATTPRTGSRCLSPKLSPHLENGVPNRTGASARPRQSQKNEGATYENSIQSFWKSDFFNAGRFVSRWIHGDSSTDEATKPACETLCFQFWYAVARGDSTRRAKGV